MGEQRHDRSCLHTARRSSGNRSTSVLVRAEQNGCGMTEYWKATDMAGRDFYSGSVNYAAALASGEPLPELSGDGDFPGPAWYHLATVPTECIGMSWPCRLFEVEPVGAVRSDTEHPHKIGCAAVRVVREVDGHVALGPQGHEVAALIGQVLTGDEVERLGAAAWGATRDAARDASRDAAWSAARDAARDAAWYAARDAAWYAARYAAWYAALGTAWGAARDATLAIVSRDLIGQYPGWDQAAYDLLTGPWRTAIGPIHPDDAPPVSDSHQIAIKESEQSDG